MFFQEVIKPHDLGDEFLGFFDGRNLTTRRDYPMMPGIIPSQGQGHVPLKVIQQPPKIAAPRQDIFPGGRRGLAPLKEAAVPRHELHQPHGSLGRHGLMGKIGFLPDEKP